MLQSKLLMFVKTWWKPVLTILLGIILLFRPDSVTSVIASAVGFAVALAGIAMLLSFFFGTHRDGLRLAGGVILMVLGFSVMRTPLSLASQLGRFVGILLVLKSVRELTGEVTLRSKSMAVISGIAGLVLMLVPMTSSRLVVSGCGLVVLAVGIGMALDKWNTLRKASKPGKDAIIDV